MPPKTSAGLLMFSREPVLRVLLVHPGGPFFARKDLGAWSIPKGLVDEADGVGDDALRAAACRELTEETGLTASGPLMPLGEVRLKSGKRVVAWAFEGSLPDDFVLRSNTFTLQWPPRSGRTQIFPEVDRAELFDLATARDKINPAQGPLLDRLEAQLEAD